MSLHSLVTNGPTRATSIAWKRLDLEAKGDVVTVADCFGVCICGMRVIELLLTMKRFNCFHILS